MTKNTKELIEFAIAAYSFILPRNGQFTFAEFAGYIKDTYDLANPVTLGIYNVILANSGTVTRTNGETRANFDL